MPSFFLKNHSSFYVKKFVSCFQSLFFIVVDHCVPFTLAIVKSQVVLQSPFVERFMYTVKLYTSLGTK